MDNPDEPGVKTVIIICALLGAVAGGAWAVHNEADFWVFAGAVVFGGIGGGLLGSVVLILLAYAAIAAVTILPVVFITAAVLGILYLIYLLIQLLF